MTKNFYNPIHHAQEKGMVNITRVQMEVDRAMIVSDRQPPLPKTIVVRIVSQEDEYNVKRALVPIINR